MAQKNNDKKNVESLEDWKELENNATGTVTEFISGDELDEGITITFDSDEPVEIEGQYGTQLGFAIKDMNGSERTLATSSKRLLGKIANHKKRLGGELTGHKFNIVRTGEGFDTKYHVTETK